MRSGAEAWGADVMTEGMAAPLKVRDQVRARRREAIVMVMIIIAFVDLLFTLDATSRGHGPEWSHLPAELVIYVGLCVMGYGLYLVIQGGSRLALPLRLTLIFLTCVLLGLAFTPLVHGAQNLLIDQPDLPWNVLTIRALYMGTMPWLFIAAALMAADFYRRVREREHQLERSQALAREAQQLALRYQIDPHFLFNALNSISTLVLTRRNEDAEDMLLRLSAFFRGTLALDTSGAIPLAQEVELQQAYLHVEQARFGADLDLEVDLCPDVAERRVPALILQPLVENAVKHGACDGVINVSGRIDDGRLLIEVANPIRSGGTPEGTGTGLRNVRDRLASAYGSEASLEIDHPAADVYRARLSMPLVG